MSIAWVTAARKQNGCRISTSCHPMMGLTNQALKLLHPYDLRLTQLDKRGSSAVPLGTPRLFNLLLNNAMRSQVDAIVLQWLGALYLEHLPGLVDEGYLTREVLGAFFGDWDERSLEPDAVFFS